MALQHNVKKISVGTGGSSLFIKEATTGYGMDGNPLEADIAWVLSLTHHTGTTESPVTGITYQRNTGTDAAPVYEPADSGTVTHATLPLPSDGYYNLKSVLVYRMSFLKPTDGIAALNRIFYDQGSNTLKKVIGANDAEADGTYVYTFAATTFEQAIEASYPALEYPFVSLFNYYTELDRLSLSYLTADAQPQCHSGVLMAHDCDNGGETYAEVRRLWFKLAYQLSGAEANLEACLKERVLKNLLEAHRLSEEIKTLSAC